MKPIELIEQYENFCKETNDLGKIFENSGIENKYKKLDFGFFPLGSGVFENPTDFQNAKLKKCKVMVVGNDFGTKKYLVGCIEKGRRESDKNPTIRNLKEKLGLDLSETFFTNLHLGVRKDGTNTKRATPLTDKYKQFCFEFLVKQIKLVNPKFILCLGHEVRLALAEYSDNFTCWKGKSLTLKKLFATANAFQIGVNDNKFGNRIFLIVPHPCDSRNFMDGYINRILAIIK
ncbi:hypothetical protein NIASO_10355 [Niabella soli DSM 19437]|uniref:Uracil-DNA glycosylase-like domain-containing protein n=2 Tax=Niabella TaxID=379899 RepID=W0F880_9BACT|nr:hypothetical protein NIASO_10355 [Niabella soli DSM 19437]